jgi:hypothetical protein
MDVRSSGRHHRSTVARRGGGRFGGVDGAGNFDPEKERKIVMLLTILVVVVMLGLVMPLFWIAGTFGAITYVGLNRMSASFKERNVALNPRLGFTMADGGEPVDEEKKESAAEPIARKPVKDKMFWWGGYC